MRIRGLLVLCTAALLFTACGGGDEDLSTDGVASVTDLQEVTPAEELVTAEDTDADETDAGVDAQEESALALATCMRDNGFDDFPDPNVGADGNLGFRDAAIAGDFDFRDPDVRAQLQTCAGESGFEGGRGANRPDPETIAEEFLAYTQCLRDEGLDVGDLEFGQQGAGQGQAQDGNGGGRGQAQGRIGPGGDRSARVANRLGLDVEDPAVAEAMTACETVLEDVLSGLGAPRGQAAGSDT